MKLALLLRESRKEIALRSVEQTGMLRGERLSQQNYSYLVRFATTLLLLLSDRIEDEEFGEIWHFLDRSSQEAADCGITFGTLLKVVSFLRIESLEILRERAKGSPKDKAAAEEEKELLSAQFDLCISKIVDSFEKRFRVAPQPGQISPADKAVSRKTASDKSSTAISSPSGKIETVAGSVSAWESLLRQGIIAGLSSGVTFGSRMRELRRSQNMTLLSLASRLGFARGYVSNIENGKTAPSFSAATAISAVLDPNNTDCLILLGIIERLPPEVRKILTSGQEARGKSETVGHKQTMTLSEEEECDEDL